MNALRADLTGAAAGVGRGTLRLLGEVAGALAADIAADGLVGRGAALRLGRNRRPIHHM
ncbi:MAG: hypothetical protein PHQ28_02265 [Mycobacterium sp.]|nr:hypothetical protein [Mycobacterium sp.]